MKRVYEVWTSTNIDTGVINAYFVSDITDDEHKKGKKMYDDSDYSTKARYQQQEFIRPRVATFPVSELYPADEQRHKAKMFCDYMNKIREAQEHAASQVALVDIITAGANTNTP